MHPIKHSKQIIVYIFIIVCTSFSGYSQNSVGINTQTPNKNAVLELVSPLNNQGFLLPKVTTAQRTALSFTDSLKAEDQGLLVYDSDENIFYYWNNGAWEKVSKGDVPALDTILSIGNSANSYRIRNLGTPIDTYDAATKKYVDDSITTIKNDITQINTDITKLYDSVTNINNDITNLYDSVTNINTDITNLYDSVTNINTDITNLYDSVTNITNQVTNLISNPNLSLADSYIFVGDATDTARAVAVSGAISIDNTGATSLSNGIVSAPKLAADVSGTPLANGTLDYVLTSQGDGSFK